MEKKTSPPLSSLKILHAMQDEKAILTTLIETIEQSQKESVLYHTQLKHQLTELSHIMIGVGGKNGLRGDLRDTKLNFKDLETRLESLEKWKTQAMAIFVVLQTLIFPLIATLVKKVFFP